LIVSNFLKKINSKSFFLLAFGEISDISPLLSKTMQSAHCILWSASIQLFFDREFSIIAKMWETTKEGGEKHV